MIDKVDNKIMKNRIIIVLLIMLLTGISPKTTLAESVAINETSFPDMNFRAYVSQYCDTGTKDGVLTDEEIGAVTYIDVTYGSITDLKGIEYFTALYELNCTGNQLSSLDVRKKTQRLQI